MNKGYSKRKRQADQTEWMRQVDELLPEQGVHTRSDYWDTLYFLYSQGLSVQEAAERMKK